MKIYIDTNNTVFQCHNDDCLLEYDNCKAFHTANNLIKQYDDLSNISKDELLEILRTTREFKFKDFSSKYNPARWETMSEQEKEQARSERQELLDLTEPVKQDVITKLSEVNIC